MDKTEQYLLIMNRPLAGLFSSFIQVLGELHYCKINNITPIVFFGSNWVYWTQGGYNESINGWEYYFSPVSEHSISDLTGKNEAYLENCNIFDFESDRIIANNNRSHKYDLSREGHIKIPSNITVVNKWPDFHLGTSSFIESRKFSACEIINEYVVVKPNILSKVDDYFNNHLADKFIIGVHMRGSERKAEIERKYGIPLASESLYTEKIDSLMQKNTDAYVFVATDTEANLDFFKNQYGARCLYYNSKRSSDGNSPHMEFGGAMIGEEMLVEALLLSRSNYLVHGISNVAFAVLCFNPNLDHIDVYSKYNSD